MQRIFAPSLVCLLILAAPGLAQQQDRQPADKQDSARRQNDQQQRQQSQEEQEKQQKQQAAQQQRSKQAAENIKAEHVFRSSTLSGMNVKNQQGENLGEVKELVIDIESGKVVYAALSFGGVLGIGDKLFAVPWKAMTLKHGEDDKHFVLAIDKERLKTAKGFDQDKWPDVANQQWAADNEKFYETATKAADQERTRR